MQGIIVTFYRLARIDTHPSLPLGPSDDSNRKRYEDYYPKSRTGLGGLSLSSAGSSRTFRQDLAQNITPLIVDPLSLTAILKTSVQIPEHLFPSISGVPGSMISFKYFVEIVIDLRGKLGQDRILPRFSLTQTPQHAYEDPRINIVDKEDGLTFTTTPGFNFLITDQIRRQKGIVFTKTEVLLGTKDTARSQAKQKARGTALMSSAIMPSQHPNSQLPNYEVNGYHSAAALGVLQAPEGAPTSSTEQPTIFPPMAIDEPSDDKARIRRAEETLLPSAPPDEGPSTGSTGLAPSAPMALDEEDFMQRYSLQAPAPRYEATTYNGNQRSSEDHFASTIASSPINEQVNVANGIRAGETQQHDAG